MAKKRERRSYLNDFQKDVNGEYQYRGAHYHYDGALEYSKLRRSLWLRCGVSAALLVIAGCLPGATKGAAAYVTLPFMLALAPPFRSLLSDASCRILASASSVILA